MRVFLLTCPSRRPAVFYQFRASIVRVLDRLDPCARESDNPVRRAVLALGGPIRLPNQKPLEALALQSLSRCWRERILIFFFSTLCLFPWCVSFKKAKRCKRFPIQWSS